MAIWVSDIKQVPVEKITNRAFTALFAVLLHGDESASYFPFFAPLFATKPKTPEPFWGSVIITREPLSHLIKLRKFFLYFQISVMSYFLYCCARNLKTNSFSVGKITKGIPKNSLFVYYFHVLGGGQMGARCIGDFVHLVANEDCEDIWMQRKR